MPGRERGQRSEEKRSGRGRTINILYAFGDWSAEAMLLRKIED